MSNLNATIGQFSLLSLPDEGEENIAYLWADNPKDKPLVRDSPLDPLELAQLIEDRNLMSKDVWTRNDYVAISNLLVGRRFLIDMNAPYGPLLSAFADRLDEEAAASLPLRELLDPSYLLIHTLPDQANNGAPGSKIFTYPTWPPGRVHATGPEPGIKGIEAVGSNVPQEWPLLLSRANTALHGNLGLAPVVAVGAPNALVGYGATPNFPFFLSFRNEKECSTPDGIYGR